MQYAVYLLLALIGAASSAHASDIPISIVDESSLPFALSPSNFENSPNNFGNSISNFENSDTTSANSESNFKNSPSNAKNKSGGSSRLIYVAHGMPKYVGYYVLSNTGVTNFFSPSGNRIFYNPKKGAAIFGGRDGSFCGALVRANGQLRLELTEHGIKLLLLSQ